MSTKTNEVDFLEKKTSNSSDEDIHAENHEKKKEFVDYFNLKVGRRQEIEKKYADETYELIQNYDGEIGELTPEKEKKLVRKLWLTVLPIVFVVNATLFIDKDAISYSSLLGVFHDMDINKAKYNNIQTYFYVGYLIGQIPSHLLFQKIPVSKYITLATGCWALISFCTLASKSYGGMSCLRFFLGIVESGITPCLEHTISMFFTIEEQAYVNPIFWISCLGIDVPTGFIAYGLQFTTKWRPWKWYWLFVAILSTIVCILSFFLYPDNPASSILFTTEEKVHIIRRIKKQSKSAIEQKTFKKYQFIEAIKDPISWLFFLFCIMDMLENSTTYQASIIYTSLGFSNLTSTLLMVVQNGFSTFCGLCGSIALFLFKKQSCLVAAIFLIPAFAGALIAISIAYDNKPGLLAGIFLTRTNGTAYIIGLSLSQATAAGYTKRLTRTVLFMIAYGIGNIVSPQMWRPQYAPRYRVPWIIQLIFCWFLAPLTLLLIRTILSRRNKERLALMEQEDNDELDYGYIDTVDEEGNKIKQKVDISMLDLTDLENVRFIYPL